jgi:hypothetical protein
MNRTKEQDTKLKNIVNSLSELLDEIDINEIPRILIDKGNYCVEFTATIKEASNEIRYLATNVKTFK